jgi:hypothetical protein
MDEQDSDTEPHNELDWLDEGSHNMSSLAQWDFEPSSGPVRTTDDLNERFKALESRNLSDIEKRQLQALFGLLARLAVWGTRFAQSLAFRAVTTVANSPPTLFRIMGKDGGKDFFQSAKTGQGAKGGELAMTKASDTLWKTRSNDLLECMKTGLPL